MQSDMTLHGEDFANALAPTGKLRLGVYPGSPFSLMRDPATGEAIGVAVEVGRELAKRLGVPLELVEHRRIAEVLAAIKAGQVDATIANASPGRLNDYDWTPPVLLIELGYLVLPGSPVTTIADVDRPGIRIGVTGGGTTNGVLARQFKHAVVVPAETLKAAIEMLSQRRIDAYTTNKANLHAMSDELPGSRVLDGRWGVEHLALAFPRGRGAALEYASAFVADIKAGGLVKRASERAGLRGAVDAE
jgi:polar amino acid transport system substrate-binding protein